MGACWPTTRAAGPAQSFSNGRADGSSRAEPRGTSPSRERGEAAASGGAAAGASGATQQADCSQHRAGCPFCAIAQGQRDQEKVVLETERLIVFHDRAPAATCHLQVCPKRHIDNLDALRPSAADHALVEEMVRVGQRALEQLHPGAPQQFGFHKPPFNSVRHLHLHAMALPFRPGGPKWKYVASRWTPWWLPVEAALRQLEPR